LLTPTQIFPASLKSRSRTLKRYKKNQRADFTVISLVTRSFDFLLIGFLKRSRETLLMSFVRADAQSVLLARLLRQFSLISGIIIGTRE